jgi:site-specific DNA recombinase
MSAPIRAVAYYRMSLERQEDSIDRQRSQVEPYAARNGYQIVREYADEGIAGDEDKKRKAFMRMLADAERRDFAIILCDDKDRFGRFDSISYGYYVKPLRDAGVRLETVAQGIIDWNSFAGRISDAVMQEAKKLESQATSRRVLTRMILMAREGKWLGGPAPYGYRLVPDEKYGKRLVTGDPREVEVVRLIFHLYGERGYSLDDVVAELAERGIPCPPTKNKRRRIQTDLCWNKSTVRWILRNRKYVGDMAWNTKHLGKYSSLKNGTVQTSDQKTPGWHNRPEDWIIVPDVHEALIDRPLFEKVQARLFKNKKRTTPLSKGGDFLLTGLLICGHCGWRMMGTTIDGKRYFKCCRYHHAGKHACGCNMVMEHKVLTCILRKLQEAILNPDNLAKLRAEIRRQAEAGEKGKPARRDGLRRQLAELQGKVSEGMERMALIDRDLLTEYAAKVRGWKEERDRLAAELERMERPTGTARLEEVLKIAEAHLYRLREAIVDADPRIVRQLLGELVSRVELHFDHVQRPKSVRSVFRRGLIYVRPQEALDLSDLVNAAIPTPAGSDGPR